MRVLVVRKPTNFELHGERVQRNVDRGQFKQGFFDRLQAVHEEHYVGLDKLFQALEKRNIEYRSVLRDEAWPDEFSFDVVMTVGGDGTLLSASHRLNEKIPLVGIRSSDASVGYTCAAGGDGLDAALDLMVAGKLPYVSVTRMMLRIVRARNGVVLNTVPVLNDVLFANVNPAATTVYKISMNEKYERHKSSGIWVSTAVGSTAAILAAGGERLELIDRRLQYRVRELYRIAGQTYKLDHALFDPDEAGFMIESHNEKALIALDGQHGSVDIEYGDRIEILRGPDLRLAKPEFR